MKKITLFSFLFAFAFIAAQTTVTVDGSATFNGYANVFETPANGGGFVFGSSWGVPDIKSVIDPGTNTVTLFPNFNTYADNPTDPFWVDQTTGEGNKIFEGNTYVENNTDLIGQEVTFEGTVEDFTLDTDYVVKAFIKVFNADFSVLKEESVVLTEEGDFSLTYSDVEAEDTTLQYGFSVTGLNANPDDESTLGNVVVGPINLSTPDFDLFSLVAFPNPAHESWTISNKSLSSFTLNLYDINGKLISVFENKASQDLTIDASNLKAGIYFANIISERKTNTIKLLKK